MAKHPKNVQSSQGQVRWGGGSYVYSMMNDFTYKVGDTIFSTASEKIYIVRQLGYNPLGAAYYHLETKIQGSPFEKTLVFLAETVHKHCRYYTVEIVEDLEENSFMRDLAGLDE